MLSSILSILILALSFAAVIYLRDKPFSESFELNPIYHTPPTGAETIIYPLDEVKVTLDDIKSTMHLATVYARPDYELARNYERYKRLLGDDDEHRRDD